MGPVGPNPDSSQTVLTVAVQPKLADAMVCRPAEPLRGSAEGDPSARLGLLW